MPIVSIVMPAYKWTGYIEKSIQSVINQTFKDWELLIVDDCSPDGTLERIKELTLYEPRIKVFGLIENSGAAVARNTAIEAAKGRYIAFLDSDDVWLPQKLEKQLLFMQEKKVDLVCSAYEKINENNEVIGIVNVPEKVCYTDMLKMSTIGCLTAIYDTERLGKVYMPLIRKRQDLGLWLRILRKTNYAYGLNEVLAKYQVREGSISSNKFSAAQYTWRLYRDFEELNLARSIYYFFHYSVNGVIRTKFPNLAKKIGRLS